MLHKIIIKTHKVMDEKKHMAIFTALKEYCKKNKMNYMLHNKQIEPKNLKFLAPTISPGVELREDMIYAASGSCSFDEYSQLDVRYTYSCMTIIEYDKYGKMFVKEVKDNRIDLAKK